MRPGGVMAGALAAAVALVLLWAIGWVDPPEPLTGAVARYAAVTSGPASAATVERIECGPLRRLRLYVVCTQDCAEVWRVIGVRGLLPALLADPGRVPAQPPEEARDRFNDALAREGLTLDEVSARAMIGCHMRLAGMFPDLILTRTDRIRLEQMIGDEARQQMLAESLEDPGAIERLEVRRVGDRFEARFLYWAVYLPERPVFDVALMLASDGRLVEVFATPVEATTAPDGAAPAGPDDAGMPPGHRPMDAEGP